MPDLLESLLAAPGIYVGSQADPSGSHPGGGVARVVVTVLPGGVGVSFDYEVLHPQGGRTHDEHTLLIRTPEGLRLVTAHAHADVATILAESEPGYFSEVVGEPPFPLAIRLEVPDPGHLVYSWSYGWTDRPMEVRDIGDVRLVS